MKFVFSLLFLTLNLFASAATYYIAPTGNDNNPGTITAPWAKWSKLETVKLQPGDIVYIRGGIYRSAKGNSSSSHVIWNGFNGTSANNIKIWAYPGESPVLNMDNIITTRSATAIEIINSSYVHIKGLRVTGFAQPNSSISLANWALINVTNSTIENSRADHSGMYGFMFGNGCNNILMKNCDVDHLADISMGGANGFNITGGSTATNINFYGCRAWFNSDDGWDFYKANGIVTIDNCWAFWNGYDKNFKETGDGVGFKLGPTTSNQTTARIIVRNSLAIHNKQYGFNQNTVTTYNPVILYNNVAYDNGNYGYMFGWGPAGGTPSIYRNNLSYSDQSTFVGESNDINDHNSWNGGITLNDADFQSLDTTGISGPRKADGSLPDLKLLKLVSTSDLIDKGINVGLPFSGTAPDIGAYEIVPNVVVVNQSPVVSISSPVKNASFTSPAIITITATASDPDGTISKVEFFNGTTKLGEKTSAPFSYTWSNVNEGTYSLTAVAYDNQSLKTVSTAVSVSVNKAAQAANKLPVIAISSPAKGSPYTAPATINIDVQASDPDGSISKVELFNGAVKLDEISTAPYSFVLKDLAEGSYSLQAIATDNLKAATTSNTLSLNITTLNENREFFNLYPNPNDGRFSIDFSSEFVADNYTVSVVDIIGKTVYRGEFSKEEENPRFDLSHLKAGIYIVMISGEAIVTTQKFIKG